MIKKHKLSIYILGLFVLSIFVSSAVFAEDVPFEVIKTKVNSHATVPLPEGSLAVVVDGIVSDPSADYAVKEGEYDHRIKVPIEGVTYRLEFWNVGEMGGEHGFIFKSNYGKAKLTITYQTGQAYKMVGTGKEFFGLEQQEKKEVSTPDIKKMEYDLVFTGGPHGVFTYKQKNGSFLQVARVYNGNTIFLETVPPEARYMAHQLADKALLRITNSSAFEKWMEILNQKDQEGCYEPGNSHKDSGIRFSDYSGEVMIRPCDDEDAWYGAELDMILHKDDHVKTGDDSTCVLSLADMTTFVMKPESEIILSSPPEKEDKIKLIWGKIKTNFKRMVKDGTMDVEMSQAVAGIKGTILVTEETGTASTLKVIEGHVNYTSKATGESQMIGPGEMITATKEGLGEKQKFDIIKENTTWANNEAMIKDAPKKPTKKSNNSSVNNSGNNSNNKTGISTPLIIIILLVFLAGGYYLIHKKRKSKKYLK